jgi:hypothetical protein
MANGRALGMGEPTGFVKMLACATTDRILGVHIIGANASELISEGVVAMEFGAASEDLARICHAHPTLSEVVHEAALACDKRPLHFSRRPRTIKQGRGRGAFGTSPPSFFVCLAAASRGPLQNLCDAS